MTRVVGALDRRLYVLDAAAAWEAARRLDRQWGSVRRSGKAAVLRGPHRMFNDIDDRNRLAAAIEVSKGRRDG